MRTTTGSCAPVPAAFVGSSSDRFHRPISITAAAVGHGRRDGFRVRRRVASPRHRRSPLSGPRRRGGAAELSTRRSRSANPANHMRSIAVEHFQSLMGHLPRLLTRMLLSRLEAAAACQPSRETGLPRSRGGLKDPSAGPAPGSIGGPWSAAQPAELDLSPRGPTFRRELFASGDAESVAGLPAASAQPPVREVVRCRPTDPADPNMPQPDCRHERLDLRAPVSTHHASSGFALQVALADAHHRRAVGERACDRSATPSGERGGRWQRNDEGRNQNAEDRSTHREHQARRYTRGRGQAPSGGVSDDGHGTPASATAKAHPHDQRCAAPTHQRQPVPGRARWRGDPHGRAWVRGRRAQRAKRLHGNSRPRRPATDPR